jgi:Glycosyl transferase family 2
MTLRICRSLVIDDRRSDVGIELRQIGRADCAASYIAHETPEAIRYEPKLIPELAQNRVKDGHVGRRNMTRVAGGVTRRPPSSRAAAAGAAIVSELVSPEDNSATATVHDVDASGATGRDERQAPGRVVSQSRNGHALGPRLSVVIPTLNEAKNLPYVFAALPPGLFEVIVVDGRSTDGTVDVARGLRSDVRIILEDRRGKGSALARGFAAARGDIIVMLDGDGSMDPREIPAFVEALLHGADFAKGSRNLPGAGSADITATRNLGNRSLGALVNLLFGTRYTDLCYGYNAFWRHALGVITVDCEGFEVETLINIRVARAELVVREVASFEHRRIHGFSKLRVSRDGVRVLGTIIRERARRSPRLTAKIVDGHAATEHGTA